MPTEMHLSFAMRKRKACFMFELRDILHGHFSTKKQRSWWVGLHLCVPEQPLVPTAIILDISSSKKATTLVLCFNHFGPVAQTGPVRAVSYYEAKD